MRKLLLAVAVVVMFPVVGLGDWTLSPSGTYDFGDVEVGTSSSMVFTITNLSPDVTLIITSIDSTEEFTQTGGPVAPFEMEKDASTDIEV